MNRLSLLIRLAPILLLAACSKPLPPEPSPPADFCACEGDGEYLNPKSCHSYVVCKKKEIAEIVACPRGEVIDPLSPKRPLGCAPAETTRLNQDCTFKPLPLPAEAPPEAPSEATVPTPPPASTPAP